MRFWRHRSEWTVAAAAMFCCGWGGNQFTPLLAMYRSRDGFSEVVVDALLGAYVLGLAPALLVGGGLSDRHGRKPLMTAALISAVAGSLALSTGSLVGLAAGRLLSGAGIGLAMAVGTTWVVELCAGGSVAPATGARRASLSLTAGLGVGPLVAGVLAQWGPLPTALPYWVHVIISLPVLSLVVREGRETAGETGTRSSPRRLPVAVGHPRFSRLILPMAPWIFGAAGIAYATVPEAVDSHVGHFQLLFATILTVTAMTAGFVAQPLAHRLDHARIPRAAGLAMAAMTLGMALAALTVQLGSAWVGGVLTAMVLGAALGMAMVAGLLEIQRLSDPAEMARTTGIFYALAYIGFLGPEVIAIAGHWVATSAALWFLTAAAGACALRVGTAAGGGPSTWSWSSRTTGAASSPARSST
jgi:hypothetical protein